MASLLKRLRRELDRMDRDPKAIPVATGSREYLVTCNRCGSMLRKMATAFHDKRCNALKAG